MEDAVYNGLQPIFALTGDDTPDRHLGLIKHIRVSTRHVFQSDCPLNFDQPSV